MGQRIIFLFSVLFLGLLLFSGVFWGTREARAEVYWVNDPSSSQVDGFGTVFNYPYGFGNTPFMYQPEWSSPMFGQTFSRPYQYPQNLYYQQMFPYSNNWKRQNRRNYGNARYYNGNVYYPNRSYGNNSGNGYWYYDGSPQNQYSQRNCYQGNYSQRNCDRENYRQQDRNWQNNQNYCGMPPGYYQPYTYDAPKTWEYYQHLYNSWNQQKYSEDVKSDENAEKQKSPYEQWLEQYTNQLFFDGDEKSGGEKESVKEKSGEKEKSEENKEMKKEKWEEKK